MGQGIEMKWRVFSKTEIRLMEGELAEKPESYLQEFSFVSGELAEVIWD